MALRVSLSEASRIENGIWSVTLPPSEVRQLGIGQATRGAVSILGVRGPEFDSQKRLLSMRPVDISVFHVGTTDRAIVIDLGPSEGGQPSVFTTNNVVGAPILPPRTGDQAFLEECRRHLSDRLVKMAQELLQQVRYQFQGELREGQARKWVNSPDNFLAITIQNRDQSYAIYIRGRPQDFAAKTIDIRDDRPGYCRFKLQRPEQLSEAIGVVLVSAQDH